jgi:cell division GTPase FtsZ
MEQAKTRETDVRAREREECERALAVSHDMRIIACGGAGCNIGEHIASAMPHVTLTYLNSDEASLGRAKTGKVVQVGKDVTFGRSAVYPEVGEACAARCEKEIRDALEGADLAIVVAGLGGGIGSGAAPYVAKLANSMGISTFGIAILPFAAEGPRRASALQTLKAMKDETNLTIAIDNENLLRVKDLDFNRGMHLVNEGALKIVQNFEEHLVKEYIHARLNEMELEDARLESGLVTVSDAGGSLPQGGRATAAPRYQ